MKKTQATPIPPMLPCTSPALRCSPAIFACLLTLCLFVAGCSHRRVQAPAPPPPPQEQPYPEQPYPPSPPPNAERTPQPNGRALQSEVGIASWYGAPYHNARAANGQIYDQDAMTAAHRTLPMGTVVRVTNLSTEPVCRGHHCRSRTVCSRPHFGFVPRRRPQNRRLANRNRTRSHRRVEQTVIVLARWPLVRADRRLPS